MATTGIIYDDIVKVSIGGVAFDHVTDFSLNVSQETIDVTTFDSGREKDFLASDSSWSGSFNALVAYDATEGIEQAFADVTGGSSVAILFSSASAGDPTYGGSCILTSWEKSGSKGSATTLAISFQGTGTITEGTAS